MKTLLYSDGWSMASCSTSSCTGRGRGYSNVFRLSGETD